MYDQATKKQFWSHVKKSSGCWVWTGAKNEKGYGIVKINGKTQRAIRVAYEMTKGALGDKQAMHKCANTACVRPSHLEAGTNAENQAERATREAQLLVECAIADVLPIDDLFVIFDV